MKNHAKAKGLVLTISIEAAWDKFVQQGGRCALSGLPLMFGERAKDPGTASLDRIDSQHGYVRGNVQWVHKTVNRMKTDLPEAEFVQYCQHVAAHSQTSLKVSA